MPPLIMTAEFETGIGKPYTAPILPDDSIVPADGLPTSIIYAVMDVIYQDVERERARASRRLIAAEVDRRMQTWQHRLPPDLPKRLHKSTRRALREQQRAQMRQEVTTEFDNRQWIPSWADMEQYVRAVYRSLGCPRRGSVVEIDTCLIGRVMLVAHQAPTDCLNALGFGQPIRQRHWAEVLMDCQYEVQEQMTVDLVRAINCTPQLRRRSA